jgi:molybdopterin-guanine dinucleotide biosynthesis protein A
MPTAAILAGGRAARFGGRDKSALVIEGRSILERQITELLRVTSAFPTRLVDLARDADAVVPRTERGYHPLYAAYTRACQPAVARRLADRRLTMSGLLEELRVRELTPGEIDAFGDRHRLLANVNTPADYEELGEVLGH